MIAIYKSEGLVNNGETLQSTRKIRFLGITIYKECLQTNNKSLISQFAPMKPTAGIGFTKSINSNVKSGEGI